MSEILEKELHPENNLNEIVYPKTSVNQVVGLGSLATKGSVEISEVQNLQNQLNHINNINQTQEFGIQQNGEKISDLQTQTISNYESIIKNGDSINIINEELKALKDKIENINIPTTDLITIEHDSLDFIEGDTTITYPSFKYVIYDIDMNSALSNGRREVHLFRIDEKEFIEKFFDDESSTTNLGFAIREKGIDTDNFKLLQKDCAVSYNSSFYIFSNLTSEQREQNVYLSSSSVSVNYTTQFSYYTALIGGQSEITTPALFTIGPIRKGFYNNLELLENEDYSPTIKTYLMVDCNACNNHKMEITFGIIVIPVEENDSFPVYIVSSNSWSYDYTYEDVFPEEELDTSRFKYNESEDRIELIE